MIPRAARTALLAVALFFIAVSFVLPSVSSADEGDRWTDISDETWVSDYDVEAPDAARLADGFPDGSFRPYEPVTRGQFVKMAVNGLGIQALSPGQPTFTDVPPNHWFYSYIEGGVVAGIIGGYADGTFRPATNVTRQQANSILGRYLADRELDLAGAVTGEVTRYLNLQAWFEAEGAFYLGAFQDRNTVSDVHRPTTAYLLHRDVVRGTDQRLQPLENLTRAQAVALILRLEKVIDEIRQRPRPPEGLRLQPSGPSRDPQPVLLGWAPPESTVRVYLQEAEGARLIVATFAAPDGSFSVQLPELPEGLNVIHVTSTNEFRRESAESNPVEYHYDVTPPTGRITQPADGAVIDSSRFALRATASDEGAGVGSVTFTYRAEGEEDFRTISTDFGDPYDASWGDILLPDGRYELGLIVQDRAGNTFERLDHWVTVDTEPPVVSIEEPEAPEPVHLATGEPLVVAGAADDGDIVAVEFFAAPTSELSGEPASWEPSMFDSVHVDESRPFSASWASYGGLADGGWIIAARGVDAAGNEGPLDTVHLVVDTVAPSLSLEMPELEADDSWPDRSPLTVEWTAFDAVGLTELSLEIRESAEGEWLPEAEGLDREGGLELVTPDFPDSAVVQLRLVGADRAGNRATAVGPLVELAEEPLPPLELAATHTDLGPGLTGEEISAAWLPSESVDVVEQEIYLLPEGQDLDAAAHAPVAVVAAENASWTGDSSVTADSAGAPLNEETPYLLWVVAVDEDGARAASPAAPLLVTTVDGDPEAE